MRHRGGPRHRRITSRWSWPPQDHIAVAADGQGQVAGSATRLARKDPQALPGTKKPAPLTQLVPASLPVWLFPLLTAAAAQTGGCSRPVCRRRPRPVPWRAGGHGAHRKAALLNWPAAREHKPGRRIDRRRPARSAAWWGLLLRSTSPSFASCLRLSSLLASASALTAQHNTYPGSSVPHSKWCTPQAKPLAGRAWPNCCHVTHDACVPPVLGGSTAGTQAPCVSTWTCTQIPAG